MPAPRFVAVTFTEVLATMIDRPFSMPAAGAPVRVAVLALAAWLATGSDMARAQDNERFRPIPLRGRITRVQPMTGIVLWATSEHNRTSAVQLEYSYMKYGDVVKERGRYDWRAMDRLLERVAARKHQAIVRFYFVYPGNPTTVPNYIRAMPDYHETRGLSEGKPTGFPDWTSRALQEFTLEFYEKLAARYDDDPRLAFLETGFGLWAEYHIYSGPRVIGRTFPDKTFQAAFARQLDQVFRKTPWLISVDAADDTYAPFPDREDLMKLSFGVFDDSFLCEQHKRVNEPRWNIMGRDRWKRAPAGGEISYYTAHDQKEALSVDGPHGIPFEKAAADFHITFMIANDQPKYRPIDRLKSAGLACGYRFQVLGFEASPTRSRVTVANRGVAPIYHDAFLAVNGVRSERSLKGLLPGESRTDEIASGGTSPKLTIACDRLVAGQTIEYDANLQGSPR
jgi:hypothetical protein